MKILRELCHISIGLAALWAAAAQATETTVPPPLAATRDCRIIQSGTANFPYAMLHRGIRYGTAQLLLQIGKTGQLDDLLVTAYSQPPFAWEAERVIRLWKFEPSYVEGVPVTTIVNLTFNFEVNGVLVYERKDSISTDIRDGLLPEEYAFQPLGLEKLDGIPTPVKIVKPTYPQSWAEQGLTGAVTVEFYIDDTGRVRMPCAKAFSDKRLAGLAVAAVQQWQFTPPLCHGKPVLARVRQVFRFESGAPAGTAGA